MNFDKACYVEPEGLIGGLAVWWKEQSSVTILGKCKNQIDMSIKEGGMEQRMRIF